MIDVQDIIYQQMVLITENSKNLKIDIDKKLSDIMDFKEFSAKTVDDAINEATLEMITNKEDYK